MLNDDERHVPVKIKCCSPKRFAEGGLATAADAVEGAGRYGDEMVVHVNRREFEEMRQRWGEPTINPDTGLPEFFDFEDVWDDAKDTWNDVKDYVVPVGAAALGAFAPGIGSVVGSYLPGVVGLLGETGTQALATGLLGAGAGYLAGGGKGALYGGLGGALGAYGGDLLRNGTEGVTGQMLSSLGSSALGAAGGTSTSPSQQGGGFNTNALIPALLTSAVTLMGSNQQDEALKEAKKADKAAQAEFNKPLPIYQNPRKRRVYAYGDVPDYTQEGEREYYDYNGFAEGGPVGYADGGSPDHGRSDKIKALLSPGEYVIDAETVALLGNGSTEAGAAQLDGLRQNIRKHKGSALAQGAISPDALPAAQYI